MNQPADILLYPDARFAQRAQMRPVDDALRASGNRLLATAQSLGAYGLAAAHIGLVEPLVVVSLAPVESRDYHLLCNPEIVGLSAETEIGPEGSVSLPGIEVEVFRSVSASIAYDDVDGVRHTIELSGFPARVAQHEIDQMNGIFFLEKLSRLKREAALRRYKKICR